MSQYAARRVAATWSPTYGTRNNDLLDNSSRSPQVINDWFINIAYRV
jgi:hypothetical protein